MAGKEAARPIPQGSIYLEQVAGRRDSPSSISEDSQDMAMPLLHQQSVRSLGCLNKNI